MSANYEIGIMANKNFARKLDEYIKETEKDWNTWERKELSDGSTMYRVHTSMHPSWFDSGKRLVALFNEFGYSKDEDDAFSSIMVSEENNLTHEVHSNVIGQEIFGKFDVPKKINYPAKFTTPEEDERIEKIKYAHDNCDEQKTADKLAEILMDDHIGTHMAFEGLAYSYVNGNDDFRRGIDAALTTLLQSNMSELTDIMLNQEED